MKKVLTTSIAVFLILCSNDIQAQITQTKLDQIELMKQFTGNWKAEMIRDTTWIMECKSFGNGLEFYLTAETKGRKVFEMKTLLGYDKNKDEHIEFGIIKSIPEIALYEGRFTSANKFEEILLKDISNLEKTTSIFIYEFKSTDLMIETDIKDNKTVGTFKWFRVKDD